MKNYKIFLQQFYSLLSGSVFLSSTPAILDVMIWIIIWDVSKILTGTTNNISSADWNNKTNEGNSHMMFVSHQVLWKV